jgi:hypothetical protein
MPLLLKAQMRELEAEVDIHLQCANALVVLSAKKV